MIALAPPRGSSGALPVACVGALSIMSRTAGTRSRHRFAMTLTSRSRSRGQQPRRLAMMGCIAALVLTAATLVVGVEIKGARRWIALPGLSLQPSEFLKPCFAVVAAWLIAKGRQNPRFWGTTCALLVFALIVALLLYLLMERTRLGAMIRAGVDDRQMARAVGIPVSNLFTIVFCLGAGIAGAGGVLAGPVLSAYPGLDADMLPLALIVVILGGIGSLLGAFVGSFIIGFVYTFGTALFPELAYIILFLPMIFVIAFRPEGLFGRVGA